MRIDVWVQHETKTVLVTDAETVTTGDHWEFHEWWGAVAFAEWRAAFGEMGFDEAWDRYQCILDPDDIET